jgi:hypothetical protein
MFLLKKKFFQKSLNIRNFQQNQFLLGLSLEEKKQIFFDSVEKLNEGDTSAVLSLLKYSSLNFHLNSQNGLKKKKKKKLPQWMQVYIPSTPNASEHLEIMMKL